MPDDTPPTPPGGWSRSACQGLLCPPGSQAVTVTISDCATGAQIGVLTPFVATDASGLPAFAFEVSPLFGYDEDSFADSWRGLTPKPAIRDGLYLG